MKLKRLMDLAVAVPLAIALAPVLFIVAALVRLTSPGPAVYFSVRIGQENETFEMAKFRTMRVDTPQVATHLLDNPSKWLTPVGALLRSTSLDELPQLWNVIRGEMSLVGPRPALFNQDDLVALRTAQGVHVLPPGITGLAQINGRDDLSIEEKVLLDREYLDNLSLRHDLKLLMHTVSPVLRRRSITVQ